MILSSPHQNSSLPRFSANMRGARTTKLTIAAIEAYRVGYVITCQKASSTHRRPSIVWALGVLERLRAARPPLVRADQLHAEFLRLLEDGEGAVRVVHPPR